MILKHNIAINGQTHFSGERITLSPSTIFVCTQPMKWLSEHQCAVRLAKETNTPSPTYIPIAPELILGDNGGINTINTHGQNTPVIP